VQLPCSHQCQRPAFRRAFHCWAWLAVRSCIWEVQLCPEQRLMVKPLAQAVKPASVLGGEGGSDRQDQSRSFITCFTNFGYPPCGAHVFGAAPRDALDSTRATHGPGVYDYDRTTHGSRALPAPLLVSPSGCARATSTASTSAVTTGEGRTGGTSGQSSSDDHTGEAGLPAFDR
jgi:hypothetical protein